MSLLRKPSGLIGLIGVAALLLLALLADVLFPGDPWAMVARPLLAPMQQGYLFGTDSLGRDVAAGVVHGARISVFIGVASALATGLIGVTMGLLAGYAGGWVDAALTRSTEFFQVVPAIVLAVVVLSFTGPNVATIITVIALISWPPIARLARAETMTLRHREFVMAARLQGESRFSILTGHILPNAAPPLIAALSLSIATAILTESALAFLGLGDPNTMSWGYMIGSGRTMMRQAWWITTFPGIALLISVLGINLVTGAYSDGLTNRLTRKGTQ